jgi:hypothetical protein
MTPRALYNPPKERTNAMGCPASCLGLRAFTRCSAPSAWVEAGTGRLDKKHYATAASRGDGNAVDSTAPAHSDTFDYVSIDEKYAAIQGVKTDIAWTSTRVPPDYRMPPAGECSI